MNLIHRYGVVTNSTRSFSRGRSYELVYEGRQVSFAHAKRALSHRIANLEADLGTPVFIRAGREVRLTELGTKLLRYCRVQEQAQEEFLEEFVAEFPKTATRKKDELLGTLRVGAVSSQMRSVVMPALAPLIRLNPLLRAELFVREVFEIQKLLTSGIADIVVTTGELSGASLAGLSGQLLGYERYVLIRSVLKDAARDVYLDHDAEDQLTYDFLRNSGRPARSLKRSFMEDAYGLIDGVAQGWGVAVAPLHLLDGRKDVAVVPGHRTLKVPVYLYQARQSYYSKLHRAAVQALVSADAFK